jgi:hypothetical protein
MAVNWHRASRWMAGTLPLKRVAVLASFGAVFLLFGQLLMDQPDCKPWYKSLFELAKGLLQRLTNATIYVVPSTLLRAPSTASTTSWWCFSPRTRRRAALIQMEALWSGRCGWVLP